MAALGKYKAKPIPGGARSNDKAILVLLGLTGAGKTTTLNYLFDRQNITRTDSYCSATSTIMEYSAKIQAGGDEYDLRVIDTPGFGDTIQQANLRDSRFVATFDQLLKTHEDLKSCYPTTVLLVAKFNDDRIDGETSSFIQMLKAVDTLLANYRLLDKQCPNLVFVLTHVMSENSKALQADPGPKIKLIECLVKTFTKIPTPIEVVTAENKPELYDLPKLNDYYRLPNGQYYPINLFKKIQSIAVKGEDQVGETIIREAFKDPTKISMQLQKEIELLPGNNLIVKTIFRTLQDAKFNIENTQISREIKKRWDFLDESMKQPYFNSLQITQTTFHKQKIFGEGDLPKTTEAVLKLLMDLPLNPPIISVLEAIGIVAPELPRSLGVGQFYNIFTDSAMTNSPFSMDALEYTEIGFRAARGVQGQVISETLVLNSVFDNGTKYYEDRLKQLNILDDFRVENFTSAPKEGYNIVPPKTKVTKLTGVRETRLFRIFLKQPTFSAGFRSAVSNLPQKFDKNEVQPWNAFFLANGTHVVESVYAGGCIEVVAVKRANPPPNVETSVDNVLQYISEVLSNVGVFKPMDLNALADDWEFKISFKGGDPNIIRPTIKNLFNPNGVEFFKKWKDSLAAHPVMLNSEIGLECITHFLRKTNATGAREIQNAMKALFSVPDDDTDTAQQVQQLVPEQPKVPQGKSQPIPRVNLEPKKRHSRSNSSASSNSDKSVNPVKRVEIPEPIIHNHNQPLTWKAWFKKKFKV